MAYRPTTSRSRKQNQVKLSYSNDLSSTEPIPQIIINAPTLALNADQAARELNVAVGVMYKLTKTEGFPAFWIGHSLRINRAMLQEWINEKTKEQIAKMKQEAAEADEAASEQNTQT